MFRILTPFTLKDFQMLFVAFCLASTSLSLIPFSSVFYGLSFLLIFIMERQAIHASSTFTLNYKGAFVNYLILIFSIFITNAINQTFDYRYFLFVFIILLTSPFISSEKLIKMKGQLITSILRIFALITFICFICYCIGYNGPVSKNSNPLDFKGITNHPMWLAPMCGITNIYCLYYVLYSQKRNIKLLSFLLLCSSLYLSVVAASRSALLASVLALMFFLFVRLNNVVKFAKYLMILSVVIVMVLPYLNTERISDKMEFQKENNASSRDFLWKQRLVEFNDSPFWGVGFATSGTGFHKTTGRMESGSGWFSVTTQTGIVGLCCVLFVLCNSFIGLKKLRKYRILLFYTTILLFLCFHSFFEGYIYTPGYNLCILFWLLIGFLTDVKVHLN